MAQENRASSADPKRFFFISSASQDSDMVYDICCEMNARGISICYDDGLPSDKKTEKHIDARIRDCREVIFFIDNDSPSAQNYQLKYEFVAAQKFRKPVHIITLEDVIREDYSPEQVVDVMEEIIDFSDRPEQAQTQAQPEPRYRQPDIVHLPELPAHDGKRREKNRKAKTAKAEKQDKTDKKDRQEKTEKTEPKEKNDKKRKSMPAKINIPAGVKLKAAGIAALALLAALGVFAAVNILSRVHRAVVPNLYVSAADITEGKKIYGDPAGDYQAGKDAVNVSLLKYRYDREQKCMVITGVRTRKVRTISVPEYIKGHKVKIIENQAFFECGKLTRVELPDSVTEIGSEAFAYCTALREINIPSAVAYIGPEAFWFCVKLTEIDLRSYVTTLEDSMFCCCTSLKKIILPASLQNINNCAFECCGSLTEIQIPSSVNIIGTLAFSECSNLRKITIPSSVEYIEEDAFSGCYELTVYGESGSNAEWFASWNGFSFVAV